MGQFKNFVQTPSSKNTEDAKILDEKINSFTQKTKETKKHVQKYRSYLADNRVSAGFRPSIKEATYPIHCEKAIGSHFWDIDGNEYIDFSMGFGVHLFGLSPDFIQKEVQDQLNYGTCLGPQPKLAGIVAQKISFLTKMERVAFVNSGTEAIMTALRLARAAHEKNKVVIFDGSYHGHFDGVLARKVGTKGKAPVASGVTESLVDDLIVLNYGDEASLEFIENSSDQIAAVLVEPVQSRFPENQPYEFLKKLRTITEEKNIAYIWDEVITGFRVSPGGAQEHFGIQADLATYGKVLGGGMPIGAVAGKKKYLDFIDGGHWEFGDESFPAHEMTFFAGTFCKHPLTMRAANAVLDKIILDGKKITSELNQKTKEICDELNLYFESKDIDLKAYHYGSLFRLKGKFQLDLLFFILNSKGIYIWEGRNLFLSTAHSQEDIKIFIQKVKDSIEEIQSGGRQRTEDNRSFSFYEMTDNQKKYLTEQKNVLENAANTICLSLKIKGKIDFEVFEKTINQMIQTKDVFSWKYSFHEKKQYFDHKNPVFYKKISFIDEERPWKKLDQNLSDLQNEEFDWSKQTPIRLTLFEIEEETSIFVVNANHMVLDGWSLSLFFDEFAKNYNNYLSNQKFLQNHNLQFEDHLKNQRFQKSKNENVKKYWIDMIQNKKSDFFKKKSSFFGQRIVFDFEKKIYEFIKNESKKLKMTPFLYLLGSYSKLISVFFKKEDFPIFIPVANRDDAGSEKIYGNFSKRIPVFFLHQQYESSDFYQNLKNQVYQAYANMQIEESFFKENKIDQELYFNLEPTSDLPALEGVSLFLYPYPIIATDLPLSLNVTDCEHYYHCEFDFQKDLISESEIFTIIDLWKKKMESEFFNKNESQIGFLN